MINTYKTIFISIFALIMPLFFVAGVASAAKACTPAKDGLPIPTWYQYLPGEIVDGRCEIKTNNLGGETAILVMMAIFNIVLFLAGIAAVVFVIYGGFKFLTSTGDPQKISGARTTILNALVGLVIALVAAQVVGFIAGRLV